MARSADQIDGYVRGILVRSTLAAHASLVAREYGIPAVVGTGDATGRLHDGQLVTVDGSAGIVEPARCRKKGESALRSASQIRARRRTCGGAPDPVAPDDWWLR